MQAEDAIASLMEQMSAQQGYVAPTPPYRKNNPSQQQVTTKSTSVSTTTNTPRRTNSYQQRLLTELDGYPDDEHLAGNQSIWNAYVAPRKPLSDSGNNNSSSYDLPTNPQVEVVRRRAFEKFKQECTEVLQRIQQGWGIKLPIPAMLEKWHMDAKLAEWQERKQWKNDGKIEGDLGNSEFTGSVPPLMASTEEIYTWTISAMQRHSKSCFRDPILLRPNSSSLFQSTLEPEVKKAWATANLSAKSSTVKQKSASLLPPRFGKKANQIQKALYRCICQALENFQQQLGQAVKLEQQQTQVQHHRKRRKLPKLTRDEETDQYKVTHAGITLSVHAAYFEKLQRLYDRAQVASNSSSSSTEQYSFEEALFCLLCRYDMLQGAGLQAGVPGRVMDTLLAHFDCRMECFASPLNCRYERFTSAFVVDRAFGSGGSFFDLNDSFLAQGGCFQANPPFCEGVIDALNRRIHDLLKASNNDTASSTNSTKALMFVVFVPAWKDSKAYQEGLLENTFLSRHLLLPNGKHFYAEGTQHRRKGSFRPASFDTSILFYQNDAAKIEWPISDTVLDDLKGAFCKDPGDMDKSSTSIKPTNIKGKVKASSNDPRPTKHETTVVGVGAPEGGDQPLEETNNKTAVKRRNPDNEPETKKKKNMKAKAKGEKRRQWSNANEESEAQLNLLQSLGLSADTAGEGASSSSAPKKSDKRRKRK